MEEFVHTVVGAMKLMQALLSVQLSSSPSSLVPSYPASAVLVRSTVIVNLVLRSIPNSAIQSSLQLRHI